MIPLPPSCDRRVLDGNHQLDGQVEVVVQSDGRGGSRYPMLRSSGSLAARATIDGISLVSASAHPIGGDNLHIAVDVGAHAQVLVQSPSAMLARSSDLAMPSRLEISAMVGQGAVLHWAPEPGIAAQGSEHLTEATVSLHETSSLYWSDVTVLGRVEERPGSWGSWLRVDVGGAPLLVSDLRLGPSFEGWSSAAVLSGARCVHSITVVEPGRQAPEPVTHEDCGYVVPLSPCAVQILTWGNSFLASRSALYSLLAAPAIRDWMDGALSLAIL